MRAISLAEFSGVHGFDHSRLYIKTLGSGTQKVVCENLGSRILRRLEKLPFLRNWECVQKRRIAAAREDYYTRSVFQEALEDAHGDLLAWQAIQDVTGPLTLRKARRIIRSVDKVQGGRGDNKEDYLSFSYKASLL
ncbi:hypothetical protein AAET14_004443 [Escherichia coli]|nr:hypothetical protein [Escherichia coli]HDQ6556296.1 hypothetical protein [Escherichia coli O103:H25]EET9402999.1 hypothetical protein [Escherichia coli]EET9459944.1 hypothetical protein [Escherichia coli]EEZ1236801.1 hypothetical protein [Escherichia coli]